MDTDRRAGLLGLREVLRRPAPDRRMGDALERGERRRVAEDDPAQGGAVQGPVGPEDPLPEALPDLLECRLPGSTTSRAILSASTTTAPSSASLADTVDFPDPIPPVSPMRSMSPILGRAAGPHVVLHR